MKKILLYILAIVFSAAFIPAIAAANTDKSDIEQISSLVSYEHHWYKGKSQSECESGGISLDENTFTRFKVLDCKTDTVFEISARDYVIGAVCAEMPAWFEKEALKAQAVAIYTYAVRQTLDEMENPSAELCGASLSNDPERYLAFYDNEQIKTLYGDNYDEYYEKVCNAVDEVFGQVLIYDGEPIVAAFHSMSAGKTESAENIWGGKADYLVAVDSPWDELCADFATQSVIETEQMRLIIEENIEGAVLSDTPNDWIQVVSTSDSQTVLQVQIGGVSVSGMQLRSILNLRSAAFSVEYSPPQEFVFNCKGYGHGVGMSQNGANEMAKNSLCYNEILFHYYQNTKIAEIEIVF